MTQNDPHVILSAFTLRLPYVVMVVVAVGMLSVALLLRKRRRIAMIIGGLAWILPPFYFVVEYIAIQATTSPYYFLKQPMSDLGVTTCGPSTYSLAAYEICSPYHLLINWANVLTGIAIFVGAICFYPSWPTSRKTKIATVLLVIFGWSNTMVGVIPANVNFTWHVLVALPGMVVQIPALFLIAKAVSTAMPKFSVWTYACATLTSVSLLLICIQPFTNLPGGLLQRLLYASVYVWAAGTAIVLWNHIRSGHNRPLMAP